MQLNMDTRQILLSGLFLWLFAVVGTAIVAITERGTEAQIIENERVSSATTRH